MATLGDIVHQVQSFFTLDRTKAPPRRRDVTNPVFSDPPVGGIYASWTRWSDERKQRMALASSWAFSAISQIARATLPAEMMIQRRVGEEIEEIANHPLEVIMRSPNPDLSREYVMLHTITDLHLHRAFWFLYPDQTGNIAEIWPMPQGKISPVPLESQDARKFFPDADRDGRLFAGYVYDTGSDIILLPAESVVYFRFPDPFDPYGAMPPLHAAYDPIKLDKAQQRWNTNTFDKNHGLPRSIISVPEALPDPQFSEARKRLQEHHGRNMVIRAGTVSVDFMQQTHEAMQFLESRQLNREEIYGIFGVPLDLTNRDAWRWFVNNTVWPVLQMIAGQFTIQVARPYFGDGIFAEFSDIRPQDRALAVQEATQYWPSFTLNETRRERGQGPLPRLVIESDKHPFIDGLDLFEDVPTRMIEAILKATLEESANPTPPQLEGFSGPPSMAQAESPAQAQEREEREAGSVEDVERETEPEQPEDENKALKLAVFDWQRLATKKLETKGNATHVFLSDDLDEADSYRLATALGHCRTAAEIQVFFGEAEDYLKAIIGRRNDIPPERVQLEEDFAPEIEAWLQEQAGRVVDDVRIDSENEPPDNLFWEAEEAALAAFLTAFVVLWAESSVGSAAELLRGVGLGLDAQVNAIAADWAGEYALNLAKGLTDTTRELARVRIRNHIRAGRPLSELEDELAGIIGPRWRAELIAQTEVTRANAQARLAVADEVDAVRAVYWQTARDERVCPICRPLDRTKRGRNGLFPGGFSGPPAHPRCRCDLVFEV